MTNKIEKMLIEKCSPTLAGIKTANLFSIKIYDDFFENLQKMNEKLQEKHVYIKVLKIQNSNALLYVYRKKSLLKDLNNNKVQEILSEIGYKQGNLDIILEKLASRIGFNDEFPHEIGLFLGYPLEDVVGFICNKGKKCAMCGYWKVYSDIDHAKKKFMQFDKCQRVYKKIWSEGSRDIMRLTVA
ncbi:MAG: DUF3793 family protein [Clostridia bacterium]